MAVLYPLNLLENESWVSFGGDLYLESSAKESSEDTISPRFVFANLGFGKTSSFLGFGKTSSFFLGAGLGDIGFKTEGTVEGTDWNGKSKLDPFFQLGIAIRHSRFVIDLLYRSIKNDVEGTITGEGIDLNTKTKVKTNMALSGHNNTLLRNCLPYSRAFE